MTIGVAVSTFRRPQMLARSLAAWRRLLPDHATLIVNEDDPDRPRGVAATKNAGIAALMHAGVDHLFLVDDDTWPKAPNWWQPYVDDELPHLMFCWGRKRRLSADDHYTTWSHPRGVMLYAQRSVIDRVGGMRTEFGRWGSEHVEWSRRIHNAGLTPSPFTDLTVSPKLWHAEDMGRPRESTAALAARRRKLTTVPESDRTAIAVRRALLEKHAESAEFVPYAEEVPA